MQLKDLIKNVKTQEIIGDLNVEISDVKIDSNQVSNGSLYVCMCKYMYKNLYIRNFFTETYSFGWQRLYRMGRNSMIPSTCVSTIACLPTLLCRYSRSEWLSMKKFSVRTAGHRVFLRM